MKLTTLILLVLLCSVERTLNFEDFVHACMAKMAVDNSKISKLRQITDAAAANLGNSALFGDFSFKDLNYYEIANYPDKAKSKAKKDKAAKAPADSNPLYTQKFLETTALQSEEIIKDQLRSRREKYCLGDKVNEYQGIELKFFECYYDFHFSTDFLNSDLKRITVNGATALGDIKLVTDEAAQWEKNIKYWKKDIPSLYGFLDKTLDIIDKLRPQSININRMEDKYTFLVVYIIHVLGDLHQPIHSEAVWDETYFPSYKGEKAGNDIKVTKVKLTKNGEKIEIKSKENDPFDIHHIWDDMFEPGSKVSHGLPYTKEDNEAFNSFCDSLTKEYQSNLGKTVTSIDFATARTKIQEALKESLSIAKEHAYRSIVWANNQKAFKGYKLTGGLLFSKAVESYQREYTVEEETYNALKAHILKGTLLIQQILELISSRFENSKRKLK